MTQPPTMGRGLINLVAALGNCAALFGQLWFIWVSVFTQVPIPFYPFIGCAFLRAAWWAGKWNGWWK